MSNEFSDINTICNSVVRHYVQEKLLHLCNIFDYSAEWRKQSPQQILEYHQVEVGQLKVLLPIKKALDSGVEKDYNLIKKLRYWCKQLEIGDYE